MHHPRFCLILLWGWSLAVSQNKPYRYFWWTLPQSKHKHITVLRLVYFSHVWSKRKTTTSSMLKADIIELYSRKPGYTVLLLRDTVMEDIYEISRTILTICSVCLANEFWNLPNFHPQLDQQAACTLRMFTHSLKGAWLTLWALTSVTSSPWTDTSGLRKWHKATMAAMLAASIIFPSWFNKCRSTRICQTWMGI